MPDSQNSLALVYYFIANSSFTIFTKQDNLIMVSTTHISQPNTDVTAELPKNPVGFMQEDNGNSSSMRLMSLIALISAITFGGITLANPEVKDVGINLTFTFLVAAFTPKAVQKFAENKVK